jgi:hypothetical protein
LGFPSRHPIIWVFWTSFLDSSFTYKLFL